MARPKTATDPQAKRVIPVTFKTVAEKQAAQAHAASKGQSLAGLLKLLLAADMKAVVRPVALDGKG